MDDIEFMEIWDASDDMLEEPTGLKFIQFGLLDDIVKELTLLDILHHEE